MFCKVLLYCIGHRKESDIKTRRTGRCRYCIQCVFLIVVCLIDSMNDVTQSDRRIMPKHKQFGGEAVALKIIQALYLTQPQL